MPVATDRLWTRELTRDSNPIQLTFGANLRGAHYVMCESSADSGVTSLVMWGCDGGCLVGIPSAVAMSSIAVAVAWSAASTPASEWTAELQVMEPGSDAFVTVGRIQLDNA